VDVNVNHDVLGVSPPDPHRTRARLDPDDLVPIASPPIEPIPQILHGWPLPTGHV